MAKRKSAVVPAIDRRSLFKGVVVAAATAATASPAYAEEEEDEEESEGSNETGVVSLLTQPFLQVPGDNSVNVVWFTETETGLAPSDNKVQLYETSGSVENVDASSPTREIEAETIQPERIRDDDCTHRTVFRHEAVVDSLPTFNGNDSEKVPYRVVSDGVASDVYTLQAQAQPGVGSGIKILLTSDIQCKDMCAANMQKLYEKFGNVDAVLANGDLVDRGDAYVDWFSSEKSYFKVLQGTTEHAVQGVTYTGAPLLQNAPSYAAIGNHETMGVYTDEVGSGNLSTEFNNAKTRAYAEALYKEQASTVNPTGDVSVKEEFIKNNSFNTDSYETVLTLPENDGGNCRYYSVSIGDVALIVLDVCRPWRTRTHSDSAARCFNDPLGAVGDTDSSRGFGQFIFEPIGEGSDQLAFLENALQSADFQQAKYRVVMFHWQFNSLGGNVLPFYTDPVANVVTRSSGEQQIVYTYPREGDYLVNYVQPLLEEYNVDLVFNAHSHLWNRFKTESGMNILETSNNGNTYNAFLDSKSRDVQPPYASESYSTTGDRDILFAPYEGHLDDYVLQGDPYGLSPQMPTKAELIGNNPYLMSSTITEFSILDTAKGTVDSYYFDTTQPNTEPELFDSFPIARTPDRAYDLEGDGSLCKTAGYDSGFSSTDGGVAEIVAYSATRRYAYLVIGVQKALDIVDFSTLAGAAVDGGEPVELELERRVDIGELASANIEGFTVGDITSVAVDDDQELVAVALQAELYSDNGYVMLLDLDGNYKGCYETGVQPDMVTFTHDGSKILTADEGEPREGYGDDAVDPKGSVTVADLSSETVTTVYFDEWDSKRDSLVANNVLLKKGLYPSVDFEPEYITISPDDSLAFVSLQEANAIATLDLDSLEFTAMNPLGFKNHLIANNELDFDANDEEIIIRWGNLWGVYMPDGIDCYEVDDTIYVLTANEGDASEWGDYTNIKTSVVGNDPQWNDIEAEVLDEDKMDGLPEQAAGAQYMLGGRSFSIYRVEDDGSLEQVFDSGSDFERITSSYYPERFNASNKNNDLDSRSDSKGPEPESVVVGAVGDKMYAYIALERIGGVMLYDVTDPENPAFVDYLNTRDLTVDFPASSEDEASDDDIAVASLNEDGDEGTYDEQGDVSPEGLCFVPAADSPNGYPVVLVAFEVSGTLAAYQIAEGYVEPESDSADGEVESEESGTDDEDNASADDAENESDAESDGAASGGVSQGDSEEDNGSGTSADASDSTLGMSDSSSASSGASSDSGSEDAGSSSSGTSSTSGDGTPQMGDFAVVTAAGVAGIGAASLLGGLGISHHEKKKTDDADIQEAIDEDSDLDL